MTDRKRLVERGIQLGSLLLRLARHDEVLDQSIRNGKKDCLKPYFNVNPQNLETDEQVREREELGSQLAYGLGDGVVGTTHQYGL